MAEHLASIFGTEKDRVNCPFYFKIGACRHGDRCSRLHNRPTISQTLLLQNMYQNPILNAPLGPDGLPLPPDPQKAQDEFEFFYEDLFEELAKYGELENVNVCDNLADHMVGNVYIKYKDEEAAARALTCLQGRFYRTKPVIVEFSPVTDFREATCRQYEENTCNRGGYCNFMHLKPISRELRKKLFGRYRKEGGHVGGSTLFHRTRRSRSRSRERSRSPGRRSRRERSPRRTQRETSAERRAKIASWNRERQQKDPEPAQGGGDYGGGYGQQPGGAGHFPPPPDMFPPPPGR